MNRKQAEDMIKAGIVLSDDVVIRSGKRDIVAECSGLTVKETQEGLRAYVVYALPKTQRATKEVTARTKKGSK